MTALRLVRPILRVRDLAISLGDGTPIVEDIAFAVHAGEILGLVGESGSGKTTIATALLGATRPGAVIARGEVSIGERDILAAVEAERRAMRGPVIAHVAQDPSAALNPIMRVDAMLDESLRVHRPDLDKASRAARIAAAADDVGLPSDDAFLRRFPHQLSGGQQQRVLLALAVILEPRLIVLDEPTTALDVTTQARVLRILRELCHKHDMAAVYVSHDLAVVRELVDRVIVLYGGRIAEAGPRDAVFEAPVHPYTQGLLRAVPDLAGRRRLEPIPGHAPSPRERPSGCAFMPRCPRATEQCAVDTPALLEISGARAVACHHAGPRSDLPVSELRSIDASFTSTPLATLTDVRLSYGDATILNGVDLVLRRGLCTALVGESGSGKTSLARAIMGLIEDVEGRFDYDGEAIALDGQRSPILRRKIQYIFQQPYRALNPRQSVGEILRTAVRHFFPISRAEASRRVATALERVTLSPDLATRRPRELSGGERQRVAIARALICEPELLICDEITSALDVSVQASILALLRTLQDQGLTILFVTHDLAVVRALADQVAVLRHGRIVEEGPVGTVLDAPVADYTRALLADSPRLLSLASEF